MPQSLDTLRVGHRYKMINYGEETFFELISIKNRDDYIVMDLHSREKFNLKKKEQRILHIFLPVFQAGRKFRTDRERIQDILSSTTAMGIVTI
ncbi:MAG: hypothetical protein KFF73_09140 [Cyclobacteriaceae bacterium]|nr:hypothetical protein [Cyclobacteriaceae bacterium]